MPEADDDHQIDLRPVAPISWRKAYAGGRCADIELPDAYEVSFDLGGDDKRTSHIVRIAIARLSDGTTGLRIQGEHGPLRISPLSTNEISITTQRPS